MKADCEGCVYKRLHSSDRGPWLHESFLESARREVDRMIWQRGPEIPVELRLMWLTALRDLRKRFASRLPS